MAKTQEQGTITTTKNGVLTTKVVPTQVKDGKLVPDDTRGGLEQ